MKLKYVSVVFTVVTILLILTGCCLQHEWEEATCTAPSTCVKCGKTKGEPIAHTWEEATCTIPRTCSECGTTEGNPKAHDWADATCTEAKKCKICEKTEGEALGHNFSSYNNFVCGRCGGEKIFTNGDFSRMVRDIEVDYSGFVREYLKKELLISVEVDKISSISHYIYMINSTAVLYHRNEDLEAIKDSRIYIRAKLTEVYHILGPYYAFVLNNIAILDNELTHEEIMAGMVDRY